MKLFCESLRETTEIINFEKVILLTKQHQQSNENGKSFIFLKKI